MKDIFVPILKTYTTKKVAENAYNSFSKDLYAKKLGNNELISDINLEIFSLVSAFDLGKFFINITSSGNLFYRFTIENTGLEFKWEILFYPDEAEEEMIDSTLHAYVNGEKKESYYGSINELYNVILSYIYEETSQKISEFYLIDFSKFKPGALELLSPAFNPPRRATNF